MHHLGLPFDTRLVFPVFPQWKRLPLHWGTSGGRRRASSAIVANNDSIAIGGDAGLEDFGLRVPKTFPLSALTDFHFHLADPPLTKPGNVCEDITGIGPMQISC